MNRLTHFAHLPSHRTIRLGYLLSGVLGITAIVLSPGCVTENSQHKTGLTYSKSAPEGAPTGNAGFNDPADDLAGSGLVPVHPMRHGASAASADGAASPSGEIREDNQHGAVPAAGGGLSGPDNSAAPPAGTAAPQQRMTSNGGPPVNASTPVAVSTQTTVMNASIAGLGTLEYDGMLLPIVRPGGEYLAVQQGYYPSWDILLGRPTNDPLPRTNIAIYRIEEIQGANRQILSQQKKLDNVGFLGRSADNDGFLIEAPQDDGSRWIGKVSWETGEINWLARSGINAFADMAPDGRLAWCKREVGQDTHFQIFVQGSNEVFQIPADEGCDWYMPTWSSDGKEIIALEVHPDRTVDMAVFDVRSKSTLQHPLAQAPITRHGDDVWAYEAFSSIGRPADPANPNYFLIYHPDYSRMCVFDAANMNVRTLNAGSVSGAWYTGDSAVITSKNGVYLQSAREGAEPTELMKGMCIPRATSNPMHPFIMIALDKAQKYTLVVWAMSLVPPESSSTSTATTPIMPPILNPSGDNSKHH